MHLTTRFRRGIVQPMKKKIILKDINDLAGWKAEDEELHRKRTELFVRLRDAGFTLEHIAQIYGCTRQYVQQEIEKRSQA